MMHMTDKGIFALALHEGVVPMSYFCSKGIRTFGVGHTAAAGAPDPVTIPFGGKVDAASLQATFDTFRRDLETYSAEVRRAIKVPVAPNEFDAAVSFHFHTGAIGRANWVKRLNAGDRAGAIKGFMGYSKPASIIDRRKAEQRLFATGEYPTGKVPVYASDARGRIDWTPVQTLTMAQVLALLNPPTAATPPHSTTSPPARGVSNGLAAWFAGLFRRKA